MDQPLDLGPDESRPPLDLDRVIGEPAPAAPEDLPLFTRDDAPLITGPLTPRPPLVVRRATPEIPRARARAAKTPARDEMLFDAPRAFDVPGTFDAPPAGTSSAETPAAPARRIVAALVDVALLSALDALVLYFTLRLLGLEASQIAELPLLPLAAFMLLLNVGYFIAFTTVGGQSIGKMALDIKVISQEDSVVPIGRATVRTLAYFVSALPLGAGFLPGVISADRLALHDRLAHTRVVRPSST